MCQKSLPLMKSRCVLSSLSRAIRKILFSLGAEPSLVTEVSYISPSADVRARNPSSGRNISGNTRTPYWLSAAMICSGMPSATTSSACTCTLAPSCAAIGSTLRSVWGQPHPGDSLGARKAASERKLSFQIMPRYANSGARSILLPGRRFPSRPPGASNLAWPPKVEIV